MGGCEEVLHVSQDVDVTVLRVETPERFKRRGGVGGRRGGVGGRLASSAASFSLSEDREGVVSSVSVVAIEGQL